MNNNNKIEEIIEFVVSHPQTVASRTIMRRSFISEYYFETGAELGFQLRDVLNKMNNEKIDIYYDLIK